MRRMSRTTPLARFISITLALAATLALVACGSSSADPCVTGKGFCTNVDAGIDVDDQDVTLPELPDAETEAAPPCKNLQCQQVTCQSGDTTVTLQRLRLRAECGARRNHERAGVHGLPSSRLG
jgi:hypothetical protein